MLLHKERGITVMVLLEFSMFPLDKGESLSQYVARSLDIIDRSGLDYRLHAMGTEIEGQFDEVLSVVRDCFQAMAADCNRIECSIKFDYRKGHRGRLQAKLESVEQKLGRTLRK
jgi:uncharacterized protein (TIGR00106 family)